VKISARTLAEFCCRRGDIHYRYDEPTLAKEGIATQQALQRQSSATRAATGYQRELSIAVERRVGRRATVVSGRIDGCDPSLPVPLVEEYKTTRTDPVSLYRHAGDVHMGQLKIYAALLIVSGHQAAAFRLRLLYCHPDSLTVMPIEVVVDRVTLTAFFDRCLRAFVLAIARLELHRRRRNRALRALDFPFPSFRGAQLKLAREVYRTIRDGGALLAEAPTGAGKTAGVLFPSLRAMGEDLIDRTVFLTSRGTGSLAVTDTLRRLQPKPGAVRSVVITAKHKVCFQEEPICDPALCDFARGYYDRAPQAIAELLRADLLDRTAIERVARQHGVCPFELSLDAAVWCDVVVCDYNYVFDPVVRLKRLHGITRDRSQLLVDEAHQLSDRVRDSLSAAVDRSVVRNALQEAPPGRLRTAIAAFDRRGMAYKRAETAKRTLPANDYECVVQWPAPLLRAAQSVLGVMADEAEVVSALPALRGLGFTLTRLLRAESWFTPDRFAVLLRGNRRQWRIDIRCLDPGPHIATQLADFAAHVRFSGTLTPSILFGRLHGVPEAQTIRLPSPFSRTQLGAFVVPDVSVRYRHRERNLDGLVNLIETVISARSGNYLVALPSFDYLQQVIDRWRLIHPKRCLIEQTRDMSEPQRKHFLARFEANSNDPVTGLIVLGGVFAESVDLPGERLSGMIVVGIGLPPPTLERQCLAECYGDLGRIAAYEHPAMARVVQAAGRLIRSEADRGVLCLIDDRYLADSYGRYLPMHWQPTTVRATEMANALYAFWNTG
jgi:Rad3-related DNA helicase